MIARTPLRIIVFTVVIFSLGIGFGWIVKAQTTKPASVKTSSCLRLGGYQYIQPLLVCDTDPSRDTNSFPALKSDLDHTIEMAKAKGIISTASVYVRDIENRKELLINSDEHYFPASLKKLPLMIQYFKEAEGTPGFLDQKVTITDTTDYNAGTTIKPSQVPEFGKAYTNMELLSYMIKYSDNISFQTLLKNLGAEKFNQAYLDLQLHYQDNVVLIDDYMTTYQYSLFFRTLFNATYLSRDDSEAALNLLAHAEYKNGIAANIPDSIKIAHKFGIGVVPQSDGTNSGELHDCGIVYNANKPYVICVMTKSKSLDVSVVEKTISSISDTVYHYALDNF